MERLTTWQFDQWMAWLEWRRAVISGEEKTPTARRTLSPAESVAHIMGQYQRTQR